jgi:DNA polymerase IV
MILYLRTVPGFGIAVEECARPEIRLYPVVIGGLPQQRGLVREANIPAQRTGIRPGMTLAQARQQCPETIFLVPDLPRYEAIWGEICELLRSYTPIVEPIEPGQAVCDLTGCEQRWKEGGEMTREIILAIQDRTGITPWLGVGSNRLVAEMASLNFSPDGVTVVEPGQERIFMADLALTLLPGVDARLALTFQVLGLRTARQLAALPAAAVEQRFGTQGKQLHAYARGVDSRPIIAPPPRPAVSSSYQCEEGSWEEALLALHILSERCAAELQSRHLAGRLVCLKLHWDAPLSGRRGATSSVARDTDTMVHPTHSIEMDVDTDMTLPISNRIHSMLPQPVTPRSAIVAHRSRAEEETSTRSLAKRGTELKRAFSSAGGGMTMARTSINTAPALFEQAHRLLMQHWPRPRPGEEIARQTVQVMEIEVLEFEVPVQLGLEMTDHLSGFTPVRRQVIAEQEEAMIARHNIEPFRHPTQIDPESVLTERRFRWQAGLPWSKIVGGTPSKLSASLSGSKPKRRSL